MMHYRYGATLRPFTQLNLNRLQACPPSLQPAEGFAHGSMLFHRLLTDFEVNQFDLTFLGEDEPGEPCPHQVLEDRRASQKEATGW